MAELGVPAQTASRWYRAWVSGGRPALAGSGRVGRQRKLSDEQVRQVAAALAQGPQANGFPVGNWTVAGVSEVIERITGVRHSQTQTWTILRERLGWRGRPRAVQTVGVEAETPKSTLGDAEEVPKSDGRMVTADERLSRYAKLAVEVGVRLRPGQDLLAEAAVEHSPLARSVARAAHAARGRYVAVYHRPGYPVLARIDSIESYYRNARVIRSRTARH